VFHVVPEIFAQIDTRILWRLEQPVDYTHARFDLPADAVIFGPAMDGEQCSIPVSKHSRTRLLRLEIHITG